jgi:hypothetical protein
VIPTGSVAGLISEAASSVTSVAIGWYAWRRYPVASERPC